MDMFEYILSKTPAIVNSDSHTCNQNKGGENGKKRKKVR
jgi:hypothetical protein